MANPILKFVQSVCVQSAIYWPAPKPDGYGGYTYDSAREITVRWDGVMKEVTDNEGNSFVSDAEIIVTEDLDFSGRLYLGVLYDLTDAQVENPDLLPEIHIIRKKETTPLFRSSTEFVRMIYTRKG
jgi:hypothetical protein